MADSHHIKKNLYYKRHCVVDDLILNQEFQALQQTHICAGKKGWPGNKKYLR